MNLFSGKPQKEAGIFDRLARNITVYGKRTTSSLLAYFRRLLFPLYLFPIKLVTYSAYYTGIFFIRLGISLVKIIIDSAIFPFRSLKNFLKSVFILGVTVYMVASLFVIGDYLTKQYGWWGKFLCSVGVRDAMQDSVVRIVGGYSEGSGFFIAPDLVITNFHVIADEPSPKIIFPDGEFITPLGIVGHNGAVLALLITEKEYPDLVLPLPDHVSFHEDEPLIAAGYALGTVLTGDATFLRGRFIDFRASEQASVGYIQTDVSLVEGMSGGPLADQCGKIVGINTMSLAGLSLFINAGSARTLLPEFTDQDITKITVDPSLSPESAVEAFYTYLKARKMEDGYNLLSEEYLIKTGYEEWTGRFTDILDVDVLVTGPYEDREDTVFVKFSTKNWNDGGVDYHYYEGTWQTVKEEGMYKMLKSNIKEVFDPGWEWFYE